MTAPAYLAPGALLGERYEIVEEIGRGGYSIVYRARDRAVEADVALKLLVPPPAGARLARERLRREVQAVRGLAHPNIVGVHDFLEDRGWSFVVMDLVEGPDLGVRLRDRGPLLADEAAGIGAEVADALSAAHRSGILHRDVKPQNILLDRDGRARLTDFGAARLEGQATMTQTGALVGTIAYLAPEVMAGGRADARADVYALGMTLYFALAGQLPHRASPHLPPDPEPEGHRPGAIRAELPLWLDAAVARATCADPARRFPSAGSVAEALRQEGVAVEPAARAPALDFCLVCGSTSAAGLSRCPDCDGVPAGRSDTLVFVDRAGGVREWSAAGEALARMAAALPNRPDVSAAARGTRALVRTAGGTADRVLARFRERGVPVRAMQRGRAWSAVPATLYGLAGSIGIVGMYAGFERSTALWTTTPIAVGMLVVAAHRVVQRPVFSARVRRPALSPALDRKASEALARLPPGPARSLLLDLVRLAGAVPAPREVSDLLDHACEAALDLQQLDETLTLLERRREAAEGAPGPWMDGLSAVERSRDRLMQRLLDTVALLGRLHAGTPPPDSELEEAKQALERRMEAMQEVEEIVGGNG